MNVSCPSCARELLLPADVAGKMVKCPICQAVFAASAVGPPPLPSASDAFMPKKLLPPRPPEPRPPVAQGEGVRARPDDPRPRRRSNAPYDDVDAEPRPRGQRGYNYDDDDDSELSRKYWRRDIREAESVVAAPAICLMVYGVVYTLIGVVVGVAAINLWTRFGTRGNWLFMIALIMIMQGGLIVAGAVLMKMMRSWAFGLIASILPLITHPCNIIGIGVGIWGINVLNLSYVRRAFRRYAEGDFDDD